MMTIEIDPPLVLPTTRASNWACVIYEPYALTHRYITHTHIYMFTHLQHTNELFFWIHPIDIIVIL